MESLSPTIQTQTQPDASPKENNTPHSLRDKYTFIYEIGHGTQGRIYLAERNADGVKVAIKQLNVESVKNWKAYDLFRRESEVLSSLDISGVAKFYDAIECLDDDPPCSYIVQEYIEGKSLAEMIQSGHRFTLNRVYDIILQLLAILKQLHAHVPPVIHRDIKPSNILLKPLNGDDFQIYLIDFGAVANPQVQGGGSTVAGTFGYMAPEQMMGKPEPASDIYSLGAVAVHLISGRSPADMPVKDFHLIFEPEMQNMPPTLVAALRRMLDPNVADRLCDIDALSKLFQAFSESIYRSQTHFNDKSLSNEEFEKRLKQVEYYGQEGNIELWQRLPDETPRKFADFIAHPPMKVPVEKFDFSESKAYRNWTKKHLDMPSYENELFTTDMNSTPRPLTYTIGLFVGVFSLTFGLVGGLSGILKLQVDVFVVSVIIAICLVTLLYVYIIKKTKRERTHILDDAFSKYPYEPVDLYDSLKNDIKSIPFVDIDLGYMLKFGRKSIATVVDIQYITCNRQNIEDQYSILDTSNKAKCQCHFSCHGKPHFVISYKFNPPDDVREEDIIHKISTYTNVEEYLHIGDPLPILYWIQRTEGVAWDHVVSMPFPYPIHDPLHTTDILFADSSLGNNARIRSKLLEERKEKATLKEEQRIQDGFMVSAPED